MKTPGSFALLCGLVALLALALFPWRESEQRHTLVAREYARIVDAFIERRWLSMEAAPEGGDAAGRGPAQPRVRLDLSEATTDETKIALRFAQTSYLTADIERFNAPRSGDDRSLFDYSRNRLDAIDPRAHQFRLPYRHAGAWTGRLRLREAPAEAGIALRSTDSARRLVVLPRTVHNSMVRSVQRVDVFKASQAAWTGDTIQFERCGVEIANLWRVGDQLVVKPVDPGGSSPVDIGINGRKIALKAGANIYHLPADAVLYFKNLDPAGCKERSLESAAWVRDASEADAIYDGRSKVWQKAWEQPFFENVVETLNAAAVRRDVVIDDDVTLTLMPSVHAEARRILRDVATWKDRDKDAIRADKPRSAFTLMDGITGELLAIASFPEREDVWALSDTSRPDALLDNHNFSRHAPGSIAKIPFAAALLDSNPALAKLRIAGNYCDALAAGGKKGGCFFSSVLGIPFKPIEEASAPPSGPIGFEAAIAGSLNKYAMTLLTLGSQYPGASGAARRTIARPQDRYSLDAGGSRLGTTRPDGLLFEPGAKFRVEEVQKLPWARRMIELYGIYVGEETIARSEPVRADPAGAAPGRRRQAGPDDFAPPAARHYLWNRLPAAFQPAFQGSDARRLDAISPEYENLRLDLIDRDEEFVSHYLTLILGGSESLWSNIALAEAFATLVQNRPVEASIVAGERHDGALTERRRGAWKPLAADVHRTLVGAMRAVARTGTGKSLADTVRTLDAQARQLKEPQTFVLFAKTGTPELLLTERAPAAEIFDDMAAAGIFTRDLRTGMIRYRGKVVDPSTLPRFDQALERTAFAKDIERYFPGQVSTRCGRYDRGALWDAVFGGIVALHNGLPDEEHRRVRNLVTRSGALSATATCEVKELADDKEKFGKGIVFFAALYPLAALGPDGGIDMSYPPSRAISVAVAFQDGKVRDKYQAPHIVAASQLLKMPVARYLGLPGVDP